VSARGLGDNGAGDRRAWPATVGSDFVHGAHLTLRWDFSNIAYGNDSAGKKAFGTAKAEIALAELKTRRLG
jgi:hypothetical protein